MTIGKPLSILGIILIIYELISGINFYMKFDESGRDSDFSYTLNFGKIIVGVLLVYFGERLKKKEQ
ncbi:hypothetical protein OAD50_05870 [Vicingaceae bacterium]|nr:hypothetical protein [Vicingaceae bacterium]MDB9964580.1 hypothetical protein [Vicingaceae bacterium]MDC1450939.1 hypothetical protein [Vicingaceae bacterium]